MLTSSFFHIIIFLNFCYFSAFQLRFLREVSIELTLAAEQLLHLCKEELLVQARRDAAVSRGSDLDAILRLIELQLYIFEEKNKNKNPIFRIVDKDRINGIVSKHTS